MQINFGSFYIFGYDKEEITKLQPVRERLPGYYVHDAIRPKGGWVGEVKEKLKATNNDKICYIGCEFEENQQVLYQIGEILCHLGKDMVDSFDIAPETLNNEEYIPTNQRRRVKLQTID